jgi:uncharacterized membrane protein (UPF0127 family)
MLLKRLLMCCFLWQALACLAWMTLPACAHELQSEFKASVPVQIGGQKYHVAVAATPQAQERGLMYQTYLPKRTGMLFPINPSRPVAFWMKNTLIPLDMLFVQNNRLVQIVHNSQPCKAEPCTLYTSNVPVDAVIELPGGTARKDNLKPGAPVQVMWLP